MKENQAILEEFGSILVKDAYDECFAFPISLRNKLNPPAIVREYAALFQRLSEEDFEVLKRYHHQNLGALLFNILKIFDEHPEFAIYYEDGNQKVKLTEISEDLKAEPIIQGGWVERFSRFSSGTDRI
jgi:hypothetical protein